MTSRSQGIYATNRRSDRLRILQRVNALHHHQNHMNAAMTTAAAATPLKSTGHTCAAPSNLVFLQRCTELVRVGAGEQQLRSACPHVTARVPARVQLRCPLDCICPPSRRPTATVAAAASHPERIMQICGGEQLRPTDGNPQQRARRLRRLHTLQLHHARWMTTALMSARSARARTWRFSVRGVKTLWFPHQRCGK